MIRQQSSASYWKYLHNKDKKLRKIFAKKKDKKKKNYIFQWFRNFWHFIMPIELLIGLQ